ncbi:DNA gyrase inhibitor YacG [Stakelama tenebrarum]|uniref:DNA gyrase inhibitor YacG n=1 Tax=Stakelama tenebrarum TaxID=2711215 RepID=A0A6G6Y2A0_9SPHN|nr:DNA gyrase inhibitor YacG [Sphingosinithalassobacter tenebrarum]QIG79074.1 DNA gyrase inhibitor YacG [Sphingosinithalassobacter tenebrarum]
MTRRDSCPVCGNPARNEFKPFCSRGCKDRDLLQWLGEGYRLPGERVDPEAQSGLDTPDNRD